MGEEYGIIERAGSWYSYEDENLGQGRQNSKEFLAEHPEMMEEIEEKILVEVGMKEPEEVEAETETEDDSEASEDKKESA
jgi:recombination protein RecA